MMKLNLLTEKKAFIMMEGEKMYIPQYHKITENYE